MKLLHFLTTLLLSASPSSVGDFLYLKCDVTMQYKQIRPFPEDGEKDVVLYYEVDVKSKLLTDSAYSEDPPNEVKIQNGMIIEEFEEYEEYDGANMLMETRFTQIAFDPPGKIVGRAYVKTDDNSFESTSELEGICEASNKFEYEASK